MQLKTTVFSSLTVALLSSGMLQVQAAEAPYYNPANTASQTGKTSGYELYKTIGCPGRGILDAPCVGPAPVAPTPPAPRPVAEKSAPMPLIVDSDGDGVPDDKDRCPGTPKGAKVDAQGCELDGDKDGVVDRIDKCPTTPPGRKVNAQGCELDGDGDGVVDALDKCPTTPPGRTVNAEGCELDSDGDGILDIADQCPNTPAGDRVDAKGCSLPKVMNLQGVNFDNNRDALRPDAAAILDEAVATLKRYPGLKVEVAGHTDSRNSDAYNLDLSQRRAEAVLNYFVSQGVEADRLSAKGYGEAEPIADNGTQDGRFKNRRVELRSLD